MLRRNKKKNNHGYVLDDKYLRCYSYDGVCKGLKATQGKKYIGQTFALDISSLKKFEASPIIEPKGKLLKLLDNCKNIHELSVRGDVFHLPLIKELALGLPSSILKKITLSLCRFGAEETNYLADLIESSINLNYLFINQFEFDSSALKSLCQGVRNSNIAEFYIGVVNLTGSTKLFSFSIWQNYKLKFIEFAQVNFSSSSFLSFCTALRYNQVLESVVFFKTDSLDDNMLYKLCYNINLRKRATKLTVSLAPFQDVGGICLSRSIELGKLIKLHIRGGLITNPALKDIASSILRQQTLFRISLRILRNIDDESSCWQCLSMTFKKCVGLRQVRLTKRGIVELNESLDGRPDIIKYWTKS